MLKTILLILLGMGFGAILISILFVIGFMNTWR